MHINVNYINNGDINKLVKVFTEVTGAVLTDFYTTRWLFVKKELQKAALLFRHLLWPSDVTQKKNSVLHITQAATPYTFLFLFFAVKETSSTMNLVMVNPVALMLTG